MIVKDLIKQIPQDEIIRPELDQCWTSVETQNFASVILCVIR